MILDDNGATSERFLLFQELQVAVVNRILENFDVVEVEQIETLVTAAKGILHKVGEGLTYLFCMFFSIFCCSISYNIRARTRVKLDKNFAFLVLNKVMLKKSRVARLVSKVLELVYNILMRLIGIEAGCFSH